MTKKSSKNSAVNQKLNDLKVDPQASPQEAVTKEAAAQSMDITAPEVDPETTPPDMTQEEKEAQRDQERLDNAAQTQGKLLPMSGKSSGVEQKLQGTPAVPSPRETKQDDKEKVKAARESKKGDSPSMKRLGAIGKKMPGAEKVRVAKRGEDGELYVIRTYDANDLAQSETLEEFINTWLKPKYGSGTYSLVGVNAYGQEFDGGHIRCMGPKDSKPEQKPQADVVPGVSAMDVLNDYLKQSVERQEREVQRIQQMLSHRPEEKDPIDTVEKVMGLQEKMGGSAKKENEATMAALISSMAAQSQTTMKLMMEQQAKSNEQLLTVLSSNKGPDPLMAILIKGLLEEKSSGGGDKMPPPLPPEDPIEKMKAMSEIMKNMRSEDTSSAKLMEYALAKIDKDSFGPKDMIELMKGGQGTDDFKKSFENLSLMLGAMRNLKEHTGEGGASSGFWDALSSLVSNRDFASSVGNAIRAKTQNRVLQAPPPSYPTRQLPASQQQAPPALVGEARVMQAQEQYLTNLRAKRQALENEIAAERRAIDELAAQQPNPHAPRVREAQPVPPQPVPPQVEPVKQAQIEDPAIQPVDVHTSNPGLQQGPPAATPEQEQAVQRTVERVGRFPQMPPEISNHVNVLLEAEDEAGVVEAIINMLFYLSSLDDWEEFADTVMGLIREGDKNNAIEFLSAFFNGLQQVGFIDQSLRDKVLNSFSNQFEVITSMAQEAVELEEEQQDLEDVDEDELLDGAEQS